MSYCLQFCATSMFFFFSKSEIMIISSCTVCLFYLSFNLVLKKDLFLALTFFVCLSCLVPSWKHERCLDWFCKVRWVKTAAGVDATMHRVKCAACVFMALQRPFHIKSRFFGMKKYCASNFKNEHTFKTYGLVKCVQIRLTNQS